MSLSSRRAWIEIAFAVDGTSSTSSSLSSRRAWIEILWVTCIGIYYGCRSPRGERGLKLKLVIMNLEVVPSLSSRRAWIEIVRYLFLYCIYIVALLAESVD